MKRKKERKRIKSEQLISTIILHHSSYVLSAESAITLMTMKIAYFMQTYVKYLLQSNFLAKLCYKSYK